MKRLMFFLSALLLLLFFQACAPSKPTGDKAEFSADRVIVKLEANRRKIKTFIGSGIIEVQNSGVTLKANFEIELKKPDSLKIIITAPLGIELAEALVTENDFRFYDVLRNKVYFGKNRKGLLKQIFKVDFSFDDLMNAFTGAVDLSNNLRKLPDRYSSDDTYFVFEYINSDNNNISVYRIKKERLEITNFVLMDHSKATIFEGRYSSFKNFDDVPVPYKILVDSPRKRQNIKIDYRNIEVNKEIKALKLELPKDAEYVEW